MLPLKLTWLDRTAVIGLIMLVAGAVMVVFGLVSTFRTAVFLNESAPTEGTVIDIEKRREPRGKRFPTITYAVIEFETSDRQRIELEQETGSGIPAYVVGDQVPLRYKEDAPQDARIDSGFGIWGGTIFGIGGGAFLVGLSLIPLLPWRAREAR